ncbi:membrane hypothetical protein [Agrobacterium genomosp. 5 str. CFBP 6626]|nr:membrane hypothetical protein [Agrobacterium genomosp. 5 str. CFBP 6626]
MSDCVLSPSPPLGQETLGNAERPQPMQGKLTVAAAIAVAGSALFLAVAASRRVTVGAAAAGLAGRAALLAGAGRAACIAFRLDALEVGRDFQIIVRIARCVVAGRAGFAVVTSTFTRAALLAAIVVVAAATVVVRARRAGETGRTFA